MSAAAPADPGQVAVALGELGALGRPDIPLGALTTYRVGGPAAVGATVASPADAAAVARAVVSSGLPVLIVGRGSNLLIADAGFPGIAVVVGARRGDADAAGADDLAGVELGAVTDGRAVVTAGAAVPLPTLARRTAAAGLRGLEWTVGVPGSVGGGIRMNAGGHGSDMAGSVLSAAVADLTRPPVAPDLPAVEDVVLGDLDYGYRHSRIGPTDLVLSARFATVAGDAGEAAEVIREIVTWRREHQPGGQNAGSVFTNPAGDSAGRLIEAAGAKGRRRGSAEVSPKHANFIQADPGGSADDVHALIDEVRDVVIRHAGIDLHTEVRMIGFGET